MPADLARTAHITVIIADYLKPQGLSTSTSVAVPPDRAVLVQPPGDGAGFRGDKHSGSYGGVPSNHGLRRRTAQPLTDQVAWLPGGERVDVINCEYGQPDYEERINRRPILDEDLIPEAIEAREASGCNPRIGHLWHTHVLSTVHLVDHV